MPIHKEEQKAGKPHRAPFMQKVHQMRQEQASDDNDDIPDATDSSLFHLTGNTQVQLFEVTVMIDSKPYGWKSILALHHLWSQKVPPGSCGRTRS